MRSIERRSRIKKSDLVDFRTTLTQIDGPGKGSHVSVPISKQHKFQLAKHFPEFYFHFFGGFCFPPSFESMVQY